MKIAVLGTGMVGRIIAVKLTQLGHSVTLGTRNVENTLANDQPDGYGNPPFKNWYAGNSEIGLAAFRDAVAEGELVFNCTAGMVSIAALESAGEEQLAGKLLIDIANPLDFSNGMPPTLTPANTDSLGEQIQARFPEVKVVKTLNTMNANLMVDPSLVNGDHNVFVCGNDEGAKAQTKQLLYAFGWKESQIIDLGDISNSRGTEMLLPIWIRLWNTLGTAEFNFLIQRNN